MERGAAIDSFYVCEMDGRKITAPERLADIEGRLTAAVKLLGQNP